MVERWWHRSRRHAVHACNGPAPPHMQVALAERTHDAGDVAAGAQLYQRAMAAYEAACSLSTSEQGDDLPGTKCVSSSASDLASRMASALCCPQQAAVADLAQRPPGSPDCGEALSVQG